MIGPQIFSGHTSGIRHVMFCRNDAHLVSCADDKTVRVWDRSTGQVCKTNIFLNMFVLLYYFNNGRRRKKYNSPEFQTVWKCREMAVFLQ